MKKDHIRQAYKSSRNIYDDALTQNTLWSKLYNHLFWGVDDSFIAQKVLAAIPQGFSGKLLDVPVGTAVFTAENFAPITYRISGVCRGT
ncbi:MAG: hypothetical protein Q4C65_05900 [Eubacteriales bacterium]|nr:hypothetical protein [Eubacteriales bacterium]